MSTIISLLFVTFSIIRFSNGFQKYEEEPAVSNDLKVNPLGSEMDPIKSLINPPHQGSQNLDNQKTILNDFSPREIKLDDQHVETSRVANFRTTLDRTELKKGTNNVYNQVPDVIYNSNIYDPLSTLKSMIQYEIGTEIQKSLETCGRKKRSAGNYFQPVPYEPPGHYYAVNDGYHLDPYNLPENYERPPNYYHVNSNHPIAYPNMEHAGKILTPGHEGNLHRHRHIDNIDILYYQRHGPKHRPSVWPGHQPHITSEHHEKPHHHTHNHVIHVSGTHSHHTKPHPHMPILIGSNSHQHHHHANHLINHHGKNQFFQHSPQTCCVKNPCGHQCHNCKCEMDCCSECVNAISPHHEGYYQKYDEPVNHPHFITPVIVHEVHQTSNHIKRPVDIFHHGGAKGFKPNHIVESGDKCKSSEISKEICKCENTDDGEEVGEFKGRILMTQNGMTLCVDNLSIPCFNN